MNALHTLGMEMLMPIFALSMGGTALVWIIRMMIVPVSRGVTTMRQGVTHITIIAGRAIYIHRKGEVYE